MCQCQHHVSYWTWYLLPLLALPLTWLNNWYNLHHSHAGFLAKCWKNRIKVRHSCACLSPPWCRHIRHSAGSSPPQCRHLQAAKCTPPFGRFISPPWPKWCLTQGSALARMCVCYKALIHLIAEMFPLVPLWCNHYRGESALGACKLCHCECRLSALVICWQESMLSSLLKFSPLLVHSHHSASVSPPLH